MNVLMTTSHTRLRILRDQSGFTLILTLGVMLVTSLLLVAAFTAASGEIHLTSTDRASKKAYYAAEAGIEDYEYHLTQDGNYLTYCTAPPSPNPALNQVPETSHRAIVPEVEKGVPSEEAYAIQLLPAESDTNKSDHKCDPSHIVETMLEEQGSATGTFRIESTGYSGGAERSIVATFRNANFVSFVWYTKYETFDPIIYGTPLKTQCEAFYGKRPGECANNYFIGSESVNGPMHTEDHVAVCESPIFGRNSRDRIEFASLGHSGDEGYSNEGYGCTATPNFLGNHIPPKEVPSIEPPPGDEELSHIVEPAYEFAGKTEFTLQGATMSISKWTSSGEKVTTTGVPYPPNGVIYVTGACSQASTPFGPTPGYNQDNECGNAYVNGEYGSALTIASENDVVINGNTYPSSVAGKLGSEPSGSVMLGLIANNFVRVYHPVTKTYQGSGTKNETCKNFAGKTEHYNTTLKECEYTIPTSQSGECDAPNAPEDLSEPYVYAAILAVKHALVVDNYNCGTPTLKHLNLYGTAAALFSNGLTGVFSGSGGIIHGYPYNLVYDNRLQIEEPPHFLNPVQAAWYIQRQTLVPKR
jgi:Tfp pilus assembly protein PilX